MYSQEHQRVGYSDRGWNKTMWKLDNERRQSTHPSISLHLLSLFQFFSLLAFQFSNTSHYPINITNKNSSYCWVKRDTVNLTMMKEPRRQWLRKKIIPSNHRKLSLPSSPREEGLLSDWRRFWVTIGNGWKEAGGGGLWQFPPHTQKYGRGCALFGGCSRFKGIRKKEQQGDAATCNVIDWKTRFRVAWWGWLLAQLVPSRHTWWYTGCPWSTDHNSWTLSRNKECHFLAVPWETDLEVKKRKKRKGPIVFNFYSSFIVFLKCFSAFDWPGNIFSPTLDTPLTAFPGRFVRNWLFYVAVTLLSIGSQPLTLLLFVCY